MGFIACAKLLEGDFVIIHCLKLFSELNGLIKVRAFFGFLSHHLNSSLLQNIMKIRKSSTIFGEFKVVLGLCEGCNELTARFASSNHVLFKNIDKSALKLYKESMEFSI